MAIILSLETSTDVCSVALHDEGKLRALAEVHIPQAHASRLAVLIEEVCKQINIGKDQLKAVAVSSGPGSYTGLRIGTSTAKGICYALNIPLLSVNSLESMAWQVQRFNFLKSYLCPMLDARRMEVYCLMMDNEKKIFTPTHAKVIDNLSFSEELSDNTVLFFGPGASKCRALITHSNALFIDDVYPSASSMGILAYSNFAKGQFQDLLKYEPVYLKEFIAKKPRSFFA